MTARKLLVTCAVTWALCFAWAFIAPSWWAPVLSVVPALVGAALALGWLAYRRAARDRARQAAAEQSLMVDREVRASLTDEALAWAVATWRKRYL